MKDFYQFSIEFVRALLERIAQLVLAKHEQIQWKIDKNLSSTARGSNGFGSTGKT